MKDKHNQITATLPNTVSKRLVRGEMSNRTESYAKAETITV
ncbi:hypothetical protein GXM_07402 [Nostoc sphaeroides CCNUC1]|uniref:Uncharacterized protein n=1 Tax=Nostoc sphaeroides CCNUC1 TaxID=2653204 RepID=A0A5P8WAV5_9NOSO|nr:hypothetical protein GXM_07402 [Nostoc sphaeroides CCNUC1]